jgi:hypothetical protein
MGYDAKDSRRVWQGWLARRWYQLMAMRALAMAQCAHALINIIRF